jgi:hypothetical protein
MSTQPARQLILGVRRKIPYERHLFEEIGHDLHVGRAAEVNAKIDEWFRKYSKPK